MTLFLEGLSFLILVGLGWLLMDYLNEFSCCKAFLVKNLLGMLLKLSDSNTNPMLNLILGFLGSASNTTSVVEGQGFLMVKTSKGVFWVPHSDILAIEDHTLTIGDKTHKLYPGVGLMVSPKLLGDFTVKRGSVTKSCSGDQVPDLQDLFK